jgi:hypothetical protein
MQSRARIALNFPTSWHSAENRHYSDLEFFNRIGRVQRKVVLTFTPIEYSYMAVTGTNSDWVVYLRPRPTAALA